MIKPITGGITERVFKVCESLAMNCYCIANVNGSQNTEYIYEDLQSMGDYDSHIMFCHKIDQFICGFISGVIVAPGTSKINWFYVDKNYQRRGIGESLVGAYIDYVKSIDVKIIELESSNKISALNFYKKHGFEKIRQDYLMRKCL